MPTASDPNPERDLLLHTLAWTPAQRLAWLEEALDFALECGALEKTRRLQDRRRSDFSLTTRNAPL